MNLLLVLRNIPDPYLRVFLDPRLEEFGVAHNDW